MRIQTWGQSQNTFVPTSQHQGPTPAPYFPLPGAYLHSIYINACPHAKLLAKEPQPGHAVKEAVIELGRKRFGMCVQRTQEGCSPAPYPYRTPGALLLGTQGNRWRKQPRLGTQVTRKEPRHGSRSLVGQPWASHFSLSLSYTIGKIEVKKFLV